MRIAILGCGHMGNAIKKALIIKKIGKIFVSNKTDDNVGAAKNSDVIFVCVKPPQVPEVLTQLRPCLTPHKLLISIAAGIPLKKLFLWSGGHKKIIRVLPNLPAQVLQGMSVWKATPALKKTEKSRIKKLLCCFGKTIEVNDEKLINDACPVWGSGPAFCAALLESFERFAKRCGFSGTQARLLAIQTVLGSARYLEKTGMDFAELKQAVQTKGGVTEAAFRVLKKGKWQAIFERALVAAKKRSDELGA